MTMKDGSAGTIYFGDEVMGELGYFNPDGSRVEFEVYDPDKPRDVTLHLGATDSGHTITFRADGGMEISGDTYEAARLFWDYVKQFAAKEGS